jgi:hypothetical protein
MTDFVEEVTVESELVGDHLSRLRDRLDLVDVLIARLQRFTL